MFVIQGSMSKRGVLESLTVEYDDGICLIVERSGSKVSVAQSVWVDGVD